MGWNDIFYIADIRDMFGYDSAVARSHTEDSAYSVMVRPTGDYTDFSKHYQLNTCTDYESCLNFISRVVSSYRTFDNFMSTHSRMYDGFRVESTVELQRREKYYADFADEIANCYDDIKSAVKAGKDTRIIEGVNVSFTVTNVESDIGHRKLSNFKASATWTEFTNDLIETIYSFKGYTKQELFDSLSFLISGVDTMNDIFAEFKSYGVRSIKQMKKLKKPDLYLYLGDFINTLVMM